MKTIDVLFRNFHLITFADDNDWGVIENGSLGVVDGKIDWVGSTTDLPECEASTTIEGQGRFLSPSLIDCHTHLVYAGGRADEWQMRLAGKSYEEISRAGGGILSTVTATRAASADELFTAAETRAVNFIKQGVTTFEIKSGYGLDLDTELKMLHVARRLGEQLPIDVHPTLLGAHAIPSELEGRPDDYIDLVTREMIPAAVGVATAVDVFTENIAFDLQHTERVFQAAIDAGLAIKIHAEQLSNMGGAKLAAEMGALSADHLEYLDADGVEALAKKGTVATLLPGAYYFLNETQQPPVKLMYERGVTIALASDSNPGSSPVASILLMANMGSTLFGLTPSQSLRGLTCNAARALGIHDQVGKLQTGMAADLAVWDIGSPADLAFAIGGNPCDSVYKQGELIYSKSRGMRW